jgi:hypothetical protein
MTRSTFVGLIYTGTSTLYEDETIMAQAEYTGSAVVLNIKNKTNENLVLTQTCTQAFLPDFNPTTGRTTNAITIQPNATVRITQLWNDLTNPYHIYYLYLQFDKFKMSINIRTVGNANLSYVEVDKF